MATSTRPAWWAASRSRAIAAAEPALLGVCGVVRAVSVSGRPLGRPYM